VGTTCRWSDVQHLVDIDSLLFFARDANDKMAKVIKYATQYGTEVHQALSDAGLAPILYDTRDLKGGFTQVSCAKAFILPLYDATFQLAGTRILHQQAQQAQH
jgi:hypothetical protein